MAQRTIITLEDDLDGGPADETVRFGFDGFEYEIDLSTPNARAFRAKLQLFVEHARRPPRGAGHRSGRARGPRRNDDVREWAKQRGTAANARGRIRASAPEQYQAARKR